MRIEVARSMFWKGLLKKFFPPKEIIALDYQELDIFHDQQFVAGKCNICGQETQFYYTDQTLWRESLNCFHCRSTSRYRSIARGVLLAIQELTGIRVSSLADLPKNQLNSLAIYDTQPPFYYHPCAYPLPDLLKETGWIDVVLSQYKPDRVMGISLGNGVFNQNLECLTFSDESMDLIITSDVMEHVRLDDLAHREIHRVLRRGGIYIFTVPHVWTWEETLVRVRVFDPEDQSKDIQVLPPEYHGDTNSDEGHGVLAYRTYGRDIEKRLNEIGFDVEYTREDIPKNGIMRTELFYCRKRDEE